MTTPTKSDIRAIRDLARQDQSGDVDDSFARTGDALDTIQRWYSSAAQAGDGTLVEIVDRIGEGEAAKIYASARGHVRCACGEWSGVRCQWEGPLSETVVVEHMPDSIRASHEAAGSRGVYPHNGARRIRVERSCAENMVETDGDWCEIVEVQS